MSFEDVLHDPAIFPKPDTFDPDHWLRAAKQGVRFDRYQVAFGKGSRSCVGMNLAYAELYLVIAVLVTRFDLELYEFQYNRDCAGCVCWAAKQGKQASESQVGTESWTVVAVLIFSQALDAVGRD